MEMRTANADETMNFQFELRSPREMIPLPSRARTKISRPNHRRASCFATARPFGNVDFVAGPPAE